MSGIDYGMGQTNIDHDTGIRYGVIGVNSLSGWVCGEAEPIYPDEVETECPECGHTFDTKEMSSSDLQTCPECQHEFYDNGLDMVEPVGWDYTPNEGEYKTEYSESLNAVFVIESPYYTLAHYCSPCCPGAVDLDSPEEEGAKGYCFGHEFFEKNLAPYPVYSVKTGELVKPA